MRSLRGLGSIALLVAAFLGLGCRAIDSSEELQALAGEAPRQSAEEPAAPLPSPAGGGPAQGGSDELNAFPLVGSAFPGLGGRLHSSLCDPASDPYSTCI